jgi:hypothetical protein
MATRKIVLEPGTWYAGYHDVPFFIPEGLIQSTIAKFGVTDFAFHDREDLAPPVNPRLDPKYTDTWESWLTATYHGQPKTIEIPYYDHVDWLLVQRTRAKPPAPPVAPPAAPPVANSGWWPLVGIAAAFMWLKRRTRKRR